MPSNLLIKITVCSVQRSCSSIVEIVSVVNTSAFFFVGEDAGGYLAAATAFDLNDRKILGVINFFGLTEWDYYVQQKYQPMLPILTALLNGLKVYSFMLIL